MKPVEIIVIVAAVLIVAGVVGFAIYRKITGKSNGCDCGCGSCDGCPHCNAASKKNKKK